jgi:hypothetical protein
MAVKKKVEIVKEKCETKMCRPMPNCGGGGAIYGLGFIGAVIYYISTATGFWDGVLGVLKAIVWPVFLVFELMKFLHM